MKIIKFYAENYKKLRVVEITPEGNLVRITGPNGAGKSAVLDAIEEAIRHRAGAPLPIRAGEKSAVIELELGDIIVTRRFSERGTDLIVEAASGARFPSPQRMLDDLVGALSFDPLEFARADPRKQFDMLKTVVKLELDLGALAGLNQRDYEARTEHNRKAKELRAQAAGIVVPPDLPAEPVDVEMLTQSLTEANNTNALIEDRKRARTRAAEEMASAEEWLGRAEESLTAKIAEINEAHDDDVAAAREEIARLEAKIIEREQKRDEAVAQRKADNERDVARMQGFIATIRDRLDQEPEPPTPIDVAALAATIASSQRINTAIGERVRRADLEGQVAEAEKEAERLTDAIAARTEAKEKAIAAAAMPVKDLGFGDGIVLYRDLPFEQASDAERLRVSAAIAMAGNPALRVMRIKEGSLLDSKSLLLLGRMAEEQDWQVWIESVDESGKIGIVMDEGAVAGAPLPTRRDPHGRRKKAVPTQDNPEEGKLV